MQRWHSREESIRQTPACSGHQSCEQLSTQEDDGLQEPLLGGGKVNVSEKRKVEGRQVGVCGMVLAAAVEKGGSAGC